MINLATLFGFPFKSAKAAISTNSEAVFLKGLTRTQTFNGIIQKTNIDSSSNLVPLPKLLLVEEKLDREGKRPKV